MVFPLARGTEIGQPAPVTAQAEAGGLGQVIVLLLGNLVEKPLQTQLVFRGEGISITDDGRGGKRQIHHRPVTAHHMACPPQYAKGNGMDGKLSIGQHHRVKPGVGAYQRKIRYHAVIIFFHL